MVLLPDILNVSNVKRNLFKRRFVLKFLKNEAVLDDLKVKPVSFQLRLARVMLSSKNVETTRNSPGMNEWMYIYIPHISHIVSWRFTILLSEIERQLVKAPLPLSVHIWSHSPTQPMHEMQDETRDRPPHREVRALLFSEAVFGLLKWFPIIALRIPSGRFSRH